MLLEIKGLNKTYHSGDVAFHALHDIDLGIDSGEFMALAGPSGSGKTTLLNCIGTIDRGEKGSLILDGQDLMAKGEDELAALRKLYFGFIFQTYNLIPVLTVFENVELPLRLLRRYSDAQMRKTVLDLLAKVGLEGLEARRPMELSGGQQQRVSIARALVKNPKLVLADEPTANLDSATGREVVELMKRLNSDEGVTFVFSTHDPLIMDQARRLVRLKDGKILA